jgi:hypothetical protein
MNDALTNYRLSKLREGFAEQALAAAVSGRVDLPVADRAREWDGDAATRRVFGWADGDTARIAQAFLYRDPDMDPATQAAWKLGFADVIDQTLTIVPRGVAASAGGRGVDAADIPAEEKARIRSRICSLYATIRDSIEDWPECPFDSDGGEG